jgi:uncharacterized protein (TIGR04255 family)
LAIGSHGKLGKTYLAEVIFELRYDASVLTASVVDNFYEKIKHQFPHRENLAYSVLEFEVRQDSAWEPVPEPSDEPLDLLRFRFLSEDKKKLCQLGNGIISVNHLSYASFDSFIKDVLDVLQTQAAVFDLTAYRRLGLRYINQFPIADDPQDVFSWSAKRPPNLNADNEPLIFPKGELVLNQQQTMLNMGGLGHQNVIVAYPVQSQHQQNIMVLDIDHFLQFPQQVQPNLEFLKEWVLEVHERIWETFVQALTPDYFKELKHANNLGR